VQVQFQRVKFRFFEIRLLQPTRLDAGHLVPGSEFQNLKVEKIGFPHKTSCSTGWSTSCSYSCSTSCSIGCSTSCSYSCIISCSTSYSYSGIISCSCSVSSFMTVATPVAVPAPAAVPVAVKVFVKCWDCCFIVLVHLTLARYYQRYVLTYG
jgi:hypothetical protein